MKMEIKVFALENERQFIGMYRKTREEEVIFLKKLLRGEVVSCPRCEEADLEHLHKKAKKSNTEWKRYSKKSSSSTLSLPDMECIKDNFPSYL